MRCANWVTPCHFWKWIDDTVSPVVRYTMDMNVKKSRTHLAKRIPDNCHKPQKRTLLCIQHAWLMISACFSDYY
ncbi:hypothetical protein Leryth_026600 [Lithospermum erythrorhizon]|nr:hypothetical protein Leryth_026600 [Lithospermum erythrorhizon]